MNKSSSPVQPQELYKKYNSLNIFGDDNLTRQYHAVSASLLNYLPHIPQNRHERIFKHTLLHQHLSMIEQNDLSVLKRTTITGCKDHQWQELKSNPAIICTFHTGSYRLINLLLTKHKIPFSLAVANKVASQQGDTFRTLHKQNTTDSEDAGFKLIDAEAPTAALQMLRELKKGHSLVIYVDGNTGSGTRTHQNENCLPVNFLHQQIAARTGIGFLSHAANVPVLPVISHRPSPQENILRFFDTVRPGDNEPRKDYTHRLMQHLYDLAAPYVHDYPCQWEAWLYLHKVAKIIHPLSIETETDPARKLSEKKYFIFNSKYYGLFKIAKKNYIFNKTNYITYPLSNDIYTLLYDAKENPIDKNHIHVNLLSQLLNNQIFVSVQ
ncbi:MAG: hypothetical protein QM727_09940 [Niabella sp.]